MKVEIKQNYSEYYTLSVFSHPRNSHNVIGQTEESYVLTDAGWVHTSTYEHRHGMGVIGFKQWEIAIESDGDEYDPIVPQTWYKTWADTTAHSFEEITKNAEKIVFNFDPYEHGLLKKFAPPVAVVA